MVNLNCGFKWSLALGLVFSIIGGLFIGFWDNLFHHFLNKELAVSPSSLSYPIWVEVTELPIYFEWYFFHWENPEDINNSTIKPRFREVGPYVFREKRWKEIEAWWSHNSTVTYKVRKTWNFVRELSNGTIEDKIRTMDAIAISAPYALRFSPWWLNLALDAAMLIHGTEISVERTVEELLFGYDDPLLNLANMLPPGLIPLTIPFKKFGWLSERNGSSDWEGVFNMNTGVDDIKKLGSMDNWNGSNQTEYYGSYCGMTNGSAGELFPPKPTKTEITAFVPDLCRSISFPYEKDVNSEGFRGKRYSGNPSVFGSIKTQPKNNCFCSGEYGKCWGDGISNVTKCKWSAPAFVSFPHFLHGDPIYLNRIDGLNPDIKKHNTFIDLEETSGLPIKANISLQINLYTQPNSKYRLLKSMPETFLPICWFKQSVKLDEKLKSDLKLLVTVNKAGEIGGIVIVSIGVSLLLLSVLLKVILHKNTLVVKL